MDAVCAKFVREARGDLTCALRAAVASMGALLVEPKSRAQLRMEEVLRLDEMGLFGSSLTLGGKKVNTDAPNPRSLPPTLPLLACSTPSSRSSTPSTEYTAAAAFNPNFLPAPAPAPPAYLGSPEGFFDRNIPDTQYPSYNDYHTFMATFRFNPRPYYYQL
jgi:hypothetical protein